jgi:hypothetical protein
MYMRRACIVNIMTIYRHVASGIFPGEVWSCTMHTTGTLSLAAANAAWVTAWGTFWNGVTPPTDNIDQLIATQVETTSLATSILDPVTGKQTTKLGASSALLGTNAGATLPPQDAVVVTWRTALQTKNGRGRMYLPVFGADTLTVGRLSTASATKVANGAKNFLDSLVGAGLTPSIFNRTTKVSTAITGGDIGDVIGTQRRRRGDLAEVRTSFLV